jgi:hypothetical protein
LQSQVRELQRLLGKKTLEAEILKEALEHATGSKKQLRLPPSRAEIKAVIAELPTYGYRRVHAILKRQALAAGLTPPGGRPRIVRSQKLTRFHA